METHLLMVSPSLGLATHTALLNVDRYVDRAHH